MDVYILKTKNEINHEEVRAMYNEMGMGIVAIVEGYDDENTIRNAIPLTHFTVPKDKPIDPVAIKIQHLNAWEEIIKRNSDYAIVVLDSVRVTNTFIRHMPLGIPKGADVCIFSAPNLKMNGIHLNQTPWVLLDSDDLTYNNICNAYMISQNAAKKLYARKNDLLNAPEPFGVWINIQSNRMAIDRIATYMTLDVNSTKPIHLK